MSEAQDSTFIMPDFSECADRVGEGIYKCRVIDSKIDKWTGKDGKPDTPYIGWTLETYGEAESKNNGRKVFHNTPVLGKGAFRLRDFYRAAMGEDCPATGFDRAMLHGRELEITIAKQKDNPEYTEIKAVKAVPATVQ